MAKYPDSPPSMNQIELSPFFQRKSIVQECYKHNIAIESYSPLGKGAFIDLPELKEIGKVSLVSVADRTSFSPEVFSELWQDTCSHSHPLVLAIWLHRLTKVGQSSENRG